MTYTWRHYSNTSNRLGPGQIQEWIVPAANDRAAIAAVKGRLGDLRPSSDWSVLSAPDGRVIDFSMRPHA
jgi:hypothetical protein